MHHQSPSRGEGVLQQTASVAACELGLPEELAGKLVKETVQGAGALALQTDDELAELRRQVTSAKGTTEVALSVLTAEDQLLSLMRRTTKASFDRSNEPSASA